MANIIRHKTTHRGVYYLLKKVIGSNKKEKIFYIRYRKKDQDGKIKLIEEKAGRENADDMTAARAASMRARRIAGEEKTNAEKRAAEKREKEKASGKMTIGHLWEIYTEQKKTNSSFRQDASRYRLYLEKPFANKEPDKLIQLDIDRIRINLLKKKSPQSVMHILSLLRRLINFGSRKGLCPLLAFEIEMPKVDNKTTEDLSTAQLKRLLEAIEKDSHKHAGKMMLLALYSGMRRGEMFKLKWTDIDFRRGFITLRDPKGGVDQKIPLNDSSRKLFKGIKQNSDYVFPGRGGKQRTKIYEQVNRIKKAAKLPKGFRPLHGLRHTYASMLASSGKVDLYTLQKLLTHKTPNLTQRYAHLRDDALKNASAVASDIINDAMQDKDKKRVEK